jgi:Putative transposase
LRSNLWYCDGSCYNPHLHVIATSGGWDPQASQWVHLEYVPYTLLRKKWQWHLLTMLRQIVKTQEVNKLVNACYNTSGRF